MNWLAHTLLSKTHIEYQLGNVLADPLRGRVWKGASLPLLQGMKMHRAIDKFTDHHPVLATSKTRLGDHGHLKGVVLDLLFDHFLANRWSLYSCMGYDDYLQQFHQTSVLTADDFPEKPRRIVKRMAQTALLGQYLNFSGFVAALQRIDQRLSQRALNKESASQYLPVVEQQYDLLQRDFDEFFPQLVWYFKQHRLGSLTDHYLR